MGDAYRDLDEKGACNAKYINMIIIFPFPVQILRERLPAGVRGPGGQCQVGRVDREAPSQGGQGQALHHDHGVHGGPAWELPEYQG